MSRLLLTLSQKPAFDGYLALDQRWVERFQSGEPSAVCSSAMGTSTDLPYQRRGALAIVEITGPLSQYGRGYWDGHEAIQNRCTAALMGDGIRVLVLRIDSPGGAAAGCFDAVRYVRALAAERGILVFAWCGGDGAYSAGYAWASVAQTICLPDTGGVGSVGVLSTLYDCTAQNEMLGYRVVVVRSGQRKAEGHPDIPLTDGAIAREQSVVDQFAAIFAGDIVGPARKMSAADVLAYEGECFYGQVAVQRGLADQVMPWDEFLATCEAKAKELSMKMIMGRLGLAADASEQRGVEAVEALESRATSAESSAKESAAQLEKVTDRLADVLCEGALLAGKITAAQVPGKKELVKSHRLGLAAGVELLDKDLSAMPAMAALPRPAAESGDAPERKGSSIAGMSAEDLVKAYEALSNLARAELAKSDPAKFSAMRAAWREAKNINSNPAASAN